MPDRLWFTDGEEACELLARDPLALLVGFALDQQVTVQKAFAGPLELQRRVGRFDAETLATVDLDPVFRQKPAIHRFPGAMAERVRDLAAHLVEHYDGNAAAVWESAQSAEELKANLAALPGFGEMKVKSTAAVLAKRFGVELAAPLAPSHPTLGDVDSPQALEDYQAAKRAHKAEWMAAGARGA
ncbi:MAG TPA: HhH-GPD-type base excision DNA repair protein [Gaiellaceae bacterium]|nr:HhH-GPD-type base excision DNA repair protein [Gaiellaceae bacterium]